MPGFDLVEKKQDNPSLVGSSSAREEHEVQAAYVIAKRFPRDPHAAYNRIINACKRPTMAEQAMYAYPRGGKLVEGASIRLAEMIAQNWGNIDCGIQEVSQENGVSIMKAYAIDFETNYRSVKTFHVKHEMKAKGVMKKLEDTRDVYELSANLASRRLRACILAIIPSDIVEDAVSQVRKTMECSDVPIAEQIKKMIVAFDEYGVKPEHLEKKLGHKLDATVPAEIVTLKGIYSSIKNGMAKREDFFNLGGPSESVKDAISSLKEGKTNKDNGEAKNG